VTSASTLVRRSAARAWAVAHVRVDPGVRLRLEVVEHRVVQVTPERLDAQPVAQRHQHVQRGGRYAGAGCGGAGVERSHIVQTIGEFDHQYPDVLAGRHDHLSDGLGLGGLAVERLVELRHAVDQITHLGAEVAEQRLQRVTGVLHRVVQQRGDQRGGVHAELSADLRDRERMRDVRLAALARLAAVHVVGHRVAAAQDVGVGRRVDGLVRAGQRGDRVVVVTRQVQQRAQPLGQRDVRTGRGGRGQGTSDRGAVAGVEVHSDTPSPNVTQSPIRRPADLA
jgi:hypothetical protein